ncbi:hypothetical protein SASPL_155755 [Salvia splendens]|uniref:GAG-pre-integrase domain-containing protein n=1 Tax=Salvia splendens TaxID=180675 RepID=A0A8X8VXW8_SALSN|nr:hypothetical protein SASPL_155755 [Salvia splendens]
MRLLFLENVLAGTIQNKLTISEYFLKVKSLCSEISELDAEGAVKEARLRLYLIRGLREEFMPFISSIQGWVLYAKDKGKSKFTAKSPSVVDNFSKGEGHPKKFSQEYKVPKPVADADMRANVSIDYNYEWIIDSGYSHHATGNDSLLSCVRPHNQKKVIVTANNSLHPVVNEGKFCVDKDISLDDVYHVPGLKKNLASVSQIADSGRKDTLYVLSANEAYIEKTSQYASATLWLARLGHVGFQLLQKISENKLLEGVPQFKKINPDVVCFGTEPCPYEILYHHKPNVSLFRVFGSICYVHVLKSNRTKLDPKAKQCIFVGYDTHRKGWRCMDLETKKVVVSRDVVFDEISSDHIGANDKSITTDLLSVCGDAESNDKRSITTSSGENVQQSETIEAGARRFDRQRRPPTHLVDYEVEVNLSSMIYASLMGESCDDEPKSYDDAKDDPKWVAAMKEEFLALIRN